MLTAPTRLVGLTGFAGVGKDTAAAALAGWRRAAFADLLRTGLLALDPYIVSGFSSTRLSCLIAMHGWDGAKRDFPDVRRLMQRFGTEAGRDLHGADVWVDALFRTVTPGERVVIADVRFPNEYKAIRDRGGLIVRIVRPGIEAVNDHVSEHAIDGFVPDAIINNDGTVAELHAKIREVVGSA